MTTSSAHRAHRPLLALLAVAALLLAGVLAAATPSRAAAAPVGIMALGDSITGSPGCWRALLWQQLQRGGYTDIDMVGTLPTQGCGIAHDGDNEGHGGLLATDVASQGLLTGWLAQTRPDVVLMHFGTNDVWSNRSTAQILAAYTTLVEQMRASNPRTQVLVAQIIPVAPPTCGECAQRTVDLNAAIPGWATSLSTSASPITVVDQWTGWNPAADTSDGVHPNDAGIVKLADRWYPALAGVLDGVTPTPTPTATPTPTPTATPAPTATPTPTPTSTTAPGTGCTAVYRVANSWQGGFIGAVTVTAGSAPVSGWTVTLTLPNGAVANVWGGQAIASGSAVAVQNAAWNGSLAAGRSTEVGFQGTGSGTGATVSCAAR
ncbi:GDSL-type esterase/lipase family protein [Cellulomonas cellasea]|uniref:Lysophospholipase L1-like esterase n=1 Tax=Cellulomonas cellasea TaxID=43670 RepID=A0A7W4UG94_9CELL|nr:GDSL-type esterase/lipase family protein [Cellulomonas cellasea]MBB2923060.1 lysophospholipase L1-like esterase [Cellulomonas cellasea]